MFTATVDALAAHLANAEVAILPGASHMGHADSHRDFNRVLLDLIAATAWAG
jgi:pimeloyl-ACP methyl ester carboxylesterase